MSERVKEGEGRGCMREWEGGTWSLEHPDRLATYRHDQQTMALPTSEAQVTCHNRLGRSLDALAAAAPTCLDTT